MNENDYLPTRHSLIKRLKNWEDQQSWQDFFNTYWKFIYGVAIKTGLSDAVAQDVVQETIMTVAKKIKDFQCSPDHSFKAWLTRVIKSRIIDHIRKDKKHGASSQPTTDEPGRTSEIDRVPDPASLETDDAWDAEWEQNLLEVALEHLKKRVDADEFQLFYLHVVKQRPAKKVAETTGAKLARVHFVKYKLSRMLEREIQRLRKELI